MRQLHSVDVAWSQAVPALLWATDHSPSYVKNTALWQAQATQRMRFFFQDPKDALVFALKWGGSKQA